MNSRRFIILSVWALFWLGCNGLSSDEPANLHQLPIEELILMIKNGQLPSLESAKLKDEHGNTISSDSLITLQKTGNYFADFFLNDSAEIVEARIRAITEADKKLMNEVSRNGRSSQIKIWEVDCNQQKVLLEEVLIRDQQVRTNGIVSDFNANRDNLALVISIIEKCGMPTLEEVDSIHMEAVWQIFQHAADQKYRKKYFRALKSAAKRGDLNAGEVARMEDRILASDGQPQRYGTYIIQDLATNNWTLYELEAPERVDARRSEVGLGPLAEYLQGWQIPFSTPQIR